MKCASQMEKKVQTEKDREKGMKDQHSLRFINKQMTGALGQRM